MLLIYNCGYSESLTLLGKESKKWYVFKKRFVTDVLDKDAEHFLSMDANSIPWCPTESKKYPPFMRLEDWCAGKSGRKDSLPYQIYEAESYKNLFLLK